MTLAEIFASFPPELQPAVSQLVEVLREEFGVRRSDFDDLKAVVRELAEAQKRTEQRVEELAEAQKRTEQRVEELATAQQRMTEGLELFRKTVTAEIEGLKKSLNAQIGGLGARWGLQTEGAFREGLRAILQEVGFVTERFLDIDTTGEVFGAPDQVELDVVVKNDKVIVVEIKSATNQADLYYFTRKADFYARKTGRQIDRRLVVTPYIDPRARDAAARLGVEVCTDPVSLQSD